MKIVSDSGPLLSFARAGRLEVIRQVFGVIIIPEAAFEEIVIRGKGKPGAGQVEAGTWIRCDKVQSRVFLDRLSKK